MVSVSQTPNPLARQFSSGAPFFNAGSYTFYTQEDALCCPLAQELLRTNIVTNILITPLFITITLVDQALWNTQLSTMCAIIDKHLESGEPVVHQPDPPPTPEKDPGDLFSAVESLLEKHALPTVKEHGGHIQLVNIEDGVVYLELQGACDGCPSALITLKDGIENLLCFYIPSIKEVRAINLD